MKTIKTLLITVITTLSWSSFSQTDLPNWYVNLLEGNFLPIIVQLSEGYAVRSSVPNEVSAKIYGCRSSEEKRTSDEGIFVEVLPDGGYAIQFCEPVEDATAREAREGIGRVCSGGSCKLY